MSVYLYNNLSYLLESIIMGRLQVICFRTCIFIQTICQQIVADDEKQKKKKEFRKNIWSEND